MKTQTIGLLAILSLGVGLTGFSSTSMFQESSDITSYEEKSLITGHVTAIQRDAQGAILAYHQYDNIIVDEGLNCMTGLTFGSTNSTCPDAADPFNHIGLLGANPLVNGTDTLSTGLNVISPGGGLTQTVADDFGTTTLGDGGAGAAQGKTIASFVKLFTKANATAATIGGAYLGNTGNDALFAAKAFTGGDIVLNESDTLEITWDIQIGS